MAHLHLPPSLHTAFLNDTVAPLLRAEGLWDHFFFLRYWQGGPHLRLRMLCGPGAGSAAAAERVVAALARSLPEFDSGAREEYAYGLTLQAELARLEQEEETAGLPLGSVDRAPYAPEYRKYGGPQGVAIAETVFRETSVAVLGLLAEQAARGGTGQAPIGEAARIMAMFLRGAGLGPEAAIVFLREYEEWWRRYAPDTVRAAWPQLYRGVSPQLTNLCAAVWADSPPDDAFLATSAGATERARAAAGTAPGGDVHDLRLAGTPYLGCLSNYIHTANNRLGLVPAHEGLVAHLVRRALEERAG
ncbi:lantibiotic dehydratase C-terminal domain-containing protein [Streptomyces yaizuensis]|uniref:Thiopeptide-type bacteriocin biosynthesis protein n=1 Tax=Streptomyces yaizuensis TaxID=2989713 RepID=A0ABQ5P464_9ACTN|nr:lantibiotic dehydratase C-terminal domain-containing protein [Streptomyces sp. YSPA8]GLF97398.1 thiopeptide-type bacteriocin biosynthesis protein [Streptomyces sp. YSPA8]